MPKMNITVTAFAGRPSVVVFPTKELNGRTPSRATANTRREEATIATDVFIISPRMAMMVMKTQPARPRARS